MGKQNMAAACPKDNMECKFYLCPGDRLNV